MQKKRINIILLLVVLGLWGTVAYKTITQFFFPKQVTVIQEQFNANPSIGEHKKDTFNLTLINRDPFLNKQNNNKPLAVQRNIVEKNLNVRPKVKTPIIIKEKPVIIWPVISYYGYIKSKIKADELIMVKVDSRLYKIRKNDEVDNVIIKKIYKDSIEVIFNKEKKIIKIK